MTEAAHKDKPKPSGEKSAETKMELFGHSDKKCVWTSKGEAFTSKNSAPTGKHGGGNIMFWGRYAASGTGTFHMGGIINSLT